MTTTEKMALINRINKVQEQIRKDPDIFVIGDILGLLYECREALDNA